MSVEVKPRCCPKCAPCSSDFKKIVDLPYSGLVIYVHKKADDDNESTFADDEGLIFHNTTNKELNKPKYINELCQYKTKYNHIKTIIKRIRSLLDEIVIIKGNEVIGICEHCKRANTTKQCKKCDFMVNQFLADKKKRTEEKQKRFHEWIIKVKELLQSIMQAHSVCKHMAYKDTELERILRELKTPLSMRIPSIDIFPNVDDQLMAQSITESKEMLEELLHRIQSEGLHKPLSSKDSMYPSPSDHKETCICKLIKEGHSLENEIPALAIDKSESPSNADLRTDLITDVLQRLMDLKRVLVLETFRGVDKGLIQNLIKSINYANKHGLLPDVTNKLINQITDLQKAFSADDPTTARHKPLLDSLLLDLNKCLLMAEGLSKHLLKVLTDVCKKTAEQLAYKQSSMLSPQQYSERFSEHALASKVLKHGSAKDVQDQQIETEDKRIKPSLSKAVSKETTLKLNEGPKSKSPVKDTTSRLFKDRPGDVGKGVSKDKMSRSFIDKGKEMKKSSSKPFTDDQLKDKTRDTKKILSTEALTGQHKEDRKEISKGVSKMQQDKQKEISQTVSKMQQDKQKEISQTVSKMQQGKQKEISQTVSKMQQGKQKEISQAVSKMQQDRQKDDGKSYKDKQKETAIPKDGALGRKKDADKQKDDLLRQSLLELGRALAQGLSQALDKELVRDVTNNLRRTLTKDTEHITKGVIEALTDVCKILTKGIPKNVIKEPVIDLLGDINNIFVQGISSDENKEKLQTKLRALEKALTQTRANDLNKVGDVTAVSKEQNIDLSKDAQKKIQPDKEKQKPKEDKDQKKGEKDKDQKKGEKDKDQKKGEKDKDLEAQKKAQLAKEADLAKEKAKREKEEEQLLAKALKNKKDSDTMLAKLLSDKTKTREREVKSKDTQKDKKDMDKTNLKVLQALAELPDIKPVEPATSTDSSSSIVTSTIGSVQGANGDAKYIVIGTSLEPLHLKEVQPVESQNELFFKKNVILEGLDEVSVTLKQLPEQENTQVKETSGSIKYTLSNREFIDKGWTQLPTKKIMRRMNIYKMNPANPQYDWFKRHQEQKVMFYDTGERLAEIEHDGRGKWYYKNGSLALEYYNAEDMLVGQRYIVYSSGEECENGRRKAKTVLALFDFLGNGIIYDYNGNVRLKYNQSEGVVIDPKIGAPSRWKWHTLNEPPVLQQVFVNSRLPIRDPFIENLGKNETKPQVDIVTQQAQSDMLQVELDNFVKEKSQKLMQQFQPFRIKMKAAKLNEQFALKILDQSKISLLFRDGRTSLKLNLGMNLNNHEIIDTDISDATVVSTPYDKLPANTNSVANIQSILHSIKKSTKSINDNKTSLSTMY